MGQYYTIYNLTKKEFISPGSLNDGLKLLELNNSAKALAILLANSNGRGGGDLMVPSTEQSYDLKSHTQAYTKDGKRMQEAIDAVAGRWAGDKIVVQGDYAEKGDVAFISKNRLSKFTCINELVIKALSLDSYLKEQITEIY